MLPPICLECGRLLHTAPFNSPSCSFFQIHCTPVAPKCKYNSFFLVYLKPTFEVNIVKKMYYKLPLISNFSDMKISVLITYVLFLGKRDGLCCSLCIAFCRSFWASGLRSVGGFNALMHYWLLSVPFLMPPLEVCQRRKCSNITEWL